MKTGTDNNHSTPTFLTVFFLALLSPSGGGGPSSRFPPSFPARGSFPLAELSATPWTESHGGRALSCSSSSTEEEFRDVTCGTFPRSPSGRGRTRAFGRFVGCVPPLPLAARLLTDRSYRDVSFSWGRSRLLSPPPSSRSFWHHALTARKPGDPSESATSETLARSLAGNAECSRSGPSCQKADPPP
ncbi:hypothetical protein PUN28_007579 [Cardiocondyla obscurior]|uniref:Secreted protein n=1 Tax=Cardiocondyla obscurior TaxID=286306 RepID=A0AAW2G744_9HYME